MPTFYDPIELEEIDIKDNAASFYLIKLPGDAGFKFCATTQNLENNQFKFDPETRIDKYWPITRAQLNQANLAMLFPEDRERNQKIRTAPFQTIEELNLAFNFCPPFNPNSQQMTFGHPQIQLDDNLIQQILQQASQLGLNRTKTQWAVSPRCVPLIREGLLTVQQIAVIDATNLGWIVSPRCVPLLREGLLTVQQIANINGMKLHWIVSPECVAALRDNRTSVDQLAHMELHELKHVIESDNYPQLRMGPR